MLYTYVYAMLFSRSEYAVDDMLYVVDVIRYRYVHVK